MNLSVLSEIDDHTLTAPSIAAQPDPVPTPAAPGNDAALPEVLQFLKDLGLPALPVAPAQDPYADRQHKQNKGNGDRQWQHCPLTADHKPEPLFTGKNPSYVDRNGKPHLIKHTAYQDRLPTEKELQTWWQNPANGIGTLGGWAGYIWLDFDLKQFESQEECDRAFFGRLEAHPQLLDSWWEKTHSGGYRLAVKPSVLPNFTNFALEPGGKHRGEALGKGRFTVLAPTIGPSGNPYQCQNRAVPVEIESLEAIGIYPTQTESKPRHQPPKPKPIPIAGTIALEQLGSDSATAALRGEDSKGDRSTVLAAAYREWSGWENWTHANGIAISGSAADLAHQAGEALGIDADRVDRILKGIDSAHCQPSALHRGGEASCWKKIKRLDRATFDAVAPASVRDTLEALYQKTGGSPPRNRGGGKGGNGGNGGNGGDGDAGYSYNPADENPDAPFQQTCADLGLEFKYCCTRQQFDGSAYRVLFGGAEGNWKVINSAFYHWTGRYWEHKNDAVINTLISEYGQKAFKLCGDRDGNNPYITRPYENNKHKESAFKYCRSRLEQDAPIANRHLLAFNDVTVDLRTGQTMPHSKDFRLTHLIPHDYQPTSECPEIFMHFLLEAFGADQVEKIRAHTSAFLDPTAPYGRFPHLIGPSGGGKGTLGRFWDKLLGEGASGCGGAFSDLSTPEGRHQYLTGKSIFGFPDMGGYTQGLRAFYELVDNGPMTGRALFSPVAYQKTWNCRFWMASVNPLQIENAGDGWARRADPIGVIERRVIPDPNLGARLEAVKAGVIAWALAMPREQRDAILLAPPTSERAKNLVLESALYGDSTRSFVDACLRPSADPNAKASHAHLHTLYEAYCRQHGYTPMGQQKFISHLKTVLPRNHVDRKWLPQVNGQRVGRIPAHWQFLAPLPTVFVSSTGGSAAGLENPVWTCIKAHCVEGGIEEFEAHWNPPDISLPEPPEPLQGPGVQPVQPPNSEKTGVDSLKPLSSAGVHPVPPVHTRVWGVDSELETRTVFQPASGDQIAATVSDLSTLPGQPGQPGHSLRELVSEDQSSLDTQQATLDTLDTLNPLVKPDQLERVLKVMMEIETLDDFRVFYDRFQKIRQVQQQQAILAAFSARADYEVQERFFACREALVPIQAAAVMAESGLEEETQIELAGLDVVEREAAIGDWGLDVSR